MMLQKSLKLEITSTDGIRRGQFVPDLYFFITLSQIREQLNWIFQARNTISALKSFGCGKKDDNVVGVGKRFEAYVAVLLIHFLCISVPYVLFLTMDLGVGSFVVANALVSRQACGISNMENPEVAIYF